MPVTLRYHGHANVEILSGRHILQLDPFYTSNPLADVGPEKASPTHILISHAHFDHLGDAEAIAKRSDAQVIANHEIATYLSKRGVRKTHGMNTGGGFGFDFGRVTLTMAFHTSSFPDGTYGGMPNGFIIETGGKTIYFAGDTSIFGDMSLIGKIWKLDLAILPIGDNFTMGPQHALLAAEMLNARRIMPIHFNTFPPIQQDAPHWTQELARRGWGEPVLLQPGETFEL